MPFAPLISTTVLIASAVFSFPARDYVLVALMLFLPLMDRDWRVASFSQNKAGMAVSATLILVAVALVAWRPAYAGHALATLLMAALPEEWFFRAYFMTRLGEGFRANAIASLVFSLMHGLTRDWATAVLVFLPSLFYGWLYQRTRNLPLVVLAHALSNIVYALFLAGLVATWWPDLR